MAEAAAYRDMVAAAPAGVRRTLGLEVRDISGVTLLVAPGLPATIFNRVMGLGNGARTTDRQLDEIGQVYREAGVRSWWVHATPGEHFEALCALLAARGYTVPARKSWAKTWRDASPPPVVATPARIDLADAADAHTVGEVTCSAFGMPAVAVAWLAALVGRPGWITRVARIDDRVVGAGMLHVQGDCGWLGVAGVLSDARRAHVHRALMAARIGDARAHGCTGIVTETGEPSGDEPNPSLRNMEACGFRKLVSRLNFAAPAG